MVGGYEPHQSTSDTKIGGAAQLYKSRTAHFVEFGNYFSSRKNSKYKIGISPCTVNPGCWQPGLIRDMIINEKLRPIPINFTNLPV